MASTPSNTDPLLIGGRQFNSRLFTGTGKYPNLEAMQQSLVRSDCDMVTVAVRRGETLIMRYDMAHSGSSTAGLRLHTVIGPRALAEHRLGYTFHLRDAY